MQEEHVVDESRGPYFPFNRRETYPKRLKVDFRRLPINTLLTYTAHHDLHVRPDSTHEELAIAAARHFAAWRVNEDAIMRSFCAGLAASTIGTPRRSLGDDERAAADLKRRRLDDSLDAAGSPSPSCERSPERSPERSSFGGGVCRAEGGGHIADLLSITPLLSCVGHTVVEDRCEFGSRCVVGVSVFKKIVPLSRAVSAAWILARVVQFKPHGKVELHDEDDASHVFDLPYSEVMPLEDFSSELRKVTAVSASFSSPDRSVFRDSAPTLPPPRLHSRLVSRKVVLVYFEDDEDADGICQYRRIPVEHILPENGYGHGHPFPSLPPPERGKGTSLSLRSVARTFGSKSARAGSRRSASPRVRAGYGGEPVGFF
ncbi:unnamed protein product [Scytosiphon promiscuus]